MGSSYDKQSSNAYGRLQQQTPPALIIRDVSRLHRVGPTHTHTTVQPVPPHPPPAIEHAVFFGRRRPHLEGFAQPKQSYLGLRRGGAAPEGWGSEGAAQCPTHCHKGAGGPSGGSKPTLARSRQVEFGIWGGESEPFGVSPLGESLGRSKAPAPSGPVAPKTLDLNEKAVAHWSGPLTLSAP